MRWKIITPVLVISFFMLFSCHSGTTKNESDNQEITDMMGRKVIVPSKINKVFCSDMTTTMLMYSYNPDLLVATNNSPGQESRNYLTEQFCQLPVMGRIFIGKSQLNEEELIRINPDILLCPVFRFTEKADLECFEQTAKRLKIPAVLVDMEMDKLEDTYLFLGELLGDTIRAAELSEYCRKTMQLAEKAKSKINGSESIYIAEGENGLHTIPAGSAHSQIFEMVGLVNCADVDERYGYSDMQINMEQLINWNPSVILIGGRVKSFQKEKVLNEKTWTPLDAVKKKNIVVVPNQPYNWIGRPPGINRLIGVYWLTSIFSPELLPLDIKEETKMFYKQFYHCDLSMQQIEEILQLD